MSGGPENQETLTADERERLELLAADLREVFTEEIAKLLRIHDAQAKWIAYLERELSDTHQENRELRRRDRERGDS